MKKLSVFLAAVLIFTCFSGIPRPQPGPGAQAASVRFMEVYPEHVFEIIFEVTENPNFVANATVLIEYDASAFELLPSETMRNNKAIVMDQGGLQLGFPVSAAFRALPGAAKGSYMFRCVADQDTSIDPLGLYTDGLYFGDIQVTLEDPNASGSGVPPENGPVISAKEYGFNSYVSVDFTLEDDRRISWISIGEREFDELRADQILDKGFQRQFVGLQLPVSLEQLDGYTSATITADAVVEALNKSYDNYLVSRNETQSDPAGTTSGASSPAPGGSTAAPDGTAPVPGSSAPAPGGTTPAPGGTTPAPGGPTYAPNPPSNPNGSNPRPNPNPRPRRPRIIRFPVLSPFQIITTANKTILSDPSDPNSVIGSISMGDTARVIGEVIINGEVYLQVVCNNIIGYIVASDIMVLGTTSTSLKQFMPGPNNHKIKLYPTPAGVDPTYSPTPVPTPSPSPSPTPEPTEDPNDRTPSILDIILGVRDTWIESGDHPEEEPYPDDWYNP